MEIISTHILLEKLFYIQCRKIRWPVVPLLALTVNCSLTQPFVSEILWILTRSRNPSPSLIYTVKEKIKRAGIDTTRLRRTDQKNCPNVSAYG